MNRDHEFYNTPEKNIPEEDKARLDGFLAGRSEATKLNQKKWERKKLGKKKHGRQ